MLVSALSMPMKEGELELCAKPTPLVFGTNSFAPILRPCVNTIMLIEMHLNKYSYLSKTHSTELVTQELITKARSLGRGWWEVVLSFQTAITTSSLQIAKRKLINLLNSKSSVLPEGNWRNWAFH
jgi:hypothetical protein